MRVIGVTGFPGSGKTYLCRMLRHRLGGIEVFDADLSARRSTLPGGKAYRQFCAPLLELGLSLPSSPEQQSLVRRALAEKIFHDANLRRRLERQIHPLVWRDCLSFLSSARLKGLRQVYLDIALLYESRFSVLCDSIILVSTPRWIRCRRLRARSGFSEKLCHAMEFSQWRESWKLRQAHVRVWRATKCDYALFSRTLPIPSILRNGRVSLSLRSRPSVSSALRRERSAPAKGISSFQRRNPPMPARRPPRIVWRRL